MLANILVILAKFKVNLNFKISYTCIQLLIMSAVGLRISLDKGLYIRDPQDTTLGKNIIENAIQLLDEIGFEAFTFKKLACKMNSNEPSLYRYFKNKHMLLLYLFSWYWSWLSYLIDIKTMNILDPKERLKIIIRTIVDAPKEDLPIEYIDHIMLHDLIVEEGSKVYHTKSVDEENKKGFFLNYRELSDKVADTISEINPSFPYPHTLASNIFEMVNNHIYFAQHLPRLTDVHVKGDNFDEVEEMIEYFAFKILD